MSGPMIRASMIPTLSPPTPDRREPPAGGQLLQVAALRARASTFAPALLGEEPALRPTARPADQQAGRGCPVGSLADTRSAPSPVGVSELRQHQARRPAGTVRKAPGSPGKVEIAADRSGNPGERDIQSIAKTLVGSRTLTLGWT